MFNDKKKETTKKGRLTSLENLEIETVLIWEGKTHHCPSNIISNTIPL